MAVSVTVTADCEADRVEEVLEECNPADSELVC